MAIVKAGEEQRKSLLTLEKIDNDIYRASDSLWRPVGSRFVYGGQLIAQALMTAFNTVQDKFLVHSLHCYFLRGGNQENAVLYYVDRTRDGKTYSSRNIKATQDGVPIFTMQASFKIDETDPMEHQFTMPVVPNPEDLISSKDYMKNRLKSEEMTDAKRRRLADYVNQVFYIETRPVDPDLYYRQKQGEPRSYTWVRATEDIGDNVQLQQCMAGFLSDFGMLVSATQPAPVGHNIGFLSSLDHSVWFHNPFKAQEWMLFEIECPQCGKGKALSFGRMWRRDGVLALSMAQEGVVRSAL